MRLPNAPPTTPNRLALIATSAAVTLVTASGCGGHSAARDAGPPSQLEAGEERPDLADAEAQTDRLDAAAPTGSQAEDPPRPNFDSPVPKLLTGNSYAEIKFELLAPTGLQTAFAIFVGSPGSTRVFVNDVRDSDGGAEIRYGSASPDPDGGLAWQEVSPYRTFRIAPSSADPSLLVSERFTYLLRSRVPNPANASRQFLISLQAEDAVWAARPTEDFQRLVDGRLLGTISREEAERRPLNIGSGCLALCPSSTACLQPGGIQTLADLLDCTGSTMDADSDGDQSPDGYRLILSFEAERIDFPAAGTVQALDAGQP